MDISTIIPYGRIQKTKTTQRKKKLGDTFDLSDAAAPPPLSSDENIAAPMQPLYPKDYTQEYASPTEKSMTYGKMMLEELQTLRLGLITGRVSKDNLKHLEFLVKNRMDQAIVDDQLREILSDIETRVAVELEKLKKRRA